MKYLRSKCLGSEIPWPGRNRSEPGLKTRSSIHNFYQCFDRSRTWSMNNFTTLHSCVLDLTLQKLRNQGEIVSDTLAKSTKLQNIPKYYPLTQQHVGSNRISITPRLKHDFSWLSPSSQAMFINFSCSFFFSKTFLKLGRTRTKNYKVSLLFMSILMWWRDGGCMLISCVSFKSLVNWFVIVATKDS